MYSPFRAFYSLVAVIVTVLVLWVIVYWIVRGIDELLFGIAKAIS